VTKATIDFVSRQLLLLAVAGWFGTGANGNPRTLAQTPPPAATTIELQAETVDFTSRVRPLLSQYCFECHGPDASTRQADLRLDEPSWAIVPGQPDASALIQRVESLDEDLQMPPPEAHKPPLTEEQIGLLRHWITQGALYEPHWAYQPPKLVPLPPEAGFGLPREGPIDAWLQSSWRRSGATPVPMADPQTLVRRLSLDLTGLPPTADQIAAYVADASPDRYLRLVERLLATPQHAERLADWWLDLVRYADTVGYHGDQDHSAALYRDWVIAAFAANVPFDRFTQLQLAGDLLEPLAAEHPDDRILASAYHRLLQTSHEGGVQPAEYRAIYQADRVRNLSSVWLGATLGCAQCHDHKYDPFRIDDFYSMAAFFADIDDEQHLTSGTNTLPTRRAPERELVGPFDRPLAEHWERLLGERPDQPAEWEGRLAALRRPLMVTEALAQPRTVRILPRGNWLDQSGPPVQPAVPVLWGAGPMQDRRDLASWLVSPATEGGVGELVARVLVNRLWALLFGEGLCRSLDDFGGQGEPPDHPELLDSLAMELVAHDWDIRFLLRRIVTSQAYRLSSQMPDSLRQHDPENRYLARQNRWRLPAEGVRDIALQAGGWLVQQVGGDTARPYQPGGYYRHLNFPVREYQADDDWKQWRRGLYVHRQRMFLHPQLAAFDAPTREECTVARPRSNTPKQALVLMNDPTFVEAARGAAQQLLLAELPADDEHRLVWLWRRILGRLPDSHELQLSRQWLQQCRQTYAEQPELSRKLLEVGSGGYTASLSLAELAVWTAAARPLLNLHELYNRD
jgi:mono/diheme cytochrome c family protein